MVTEVDKKLQYLSFQEWENDTVQHTSDGAGYVQSLFGPLWTFWSRSTAYSGKDDPGQHGKINSCNMPDNCWTNL